MPTPTKGADVSGQLPCKVKLTAWCGIPAPIAEPIEALQLPVRATCLAPLLQRLSVAQVSHP